MFTQRYSTFRFDLLLVAIAALWTAFHLIVGIAGLHVDDNWVVASCFLFLLALVVSGIQFIHERSHAQAFSASDRFLELAILKFLFSSQGSFVIWFVIRMYVGARVLLAGRDMACSPEWGTRGTGLAGLVAVANPAAHGWYGWFLLNVVLPHASLISFLATWGAVAVGLGILSGILTGDGAGFSVLMIGTMVKQG